MAEKKVSARAKQVQKMTKDGLVEENLADKSSVRISKRTTEERLYRNRSPDMAEEQKLKNEPNKKEVRHEKMKRTMVQSRGDAKKDETGGSKKPRQKRRLNFAEEETGAADAVLDSKLEHSKKNADKSKLQTDYAKKQALQKHSLKKNQYVKDVTGKAAMAAGAVAHKKLQENEGDNVAVESTHKLEEGGEAISYLAKSRLKKRRNRAVRKTNRLENRSKRTQINYLYQKALSEDEKLARSSMARKLWQKQRIKRAYAKQKRAEGSTTAVTGTIEFIKKIGGKVTNFFKENRKAYISLALILGLMLLLMSSITSCGAMFLQNVATYTATSYMSEDEAIRMAELYYTQLEANLQQEIDNMEAEHPGYDRYDYNIGPIEHDPFVLISYLSAKYEVFTYEQVKAELDSLFAAQYHLTTESVRENQTTTKMVGVGESLGNVVTSGYCNCSICCGQWSGGPTASGVMPTASHTIAVDAFTPFVPMGTKVIMNGVEYTVEDTGAFTQYGVQFDVYYGSHSEASAHGHQTWEAFLADDNSTNQVEVTVTENVNAFKVTLESGSLTAICNERLGIFQKELFSAYNETKGNLQMFGSPFDVNWYGRVSSYYGYRKHPIDGEIKIHNGLDIALPEGTEIKAGLDGTVTTSEFNDSYGNYVIIKNSDGYELRYAHMLERSVSVGNVVKIGDMIGKVGSTGNSTGPHLHLELLKDGERMNPIFYMETGSGSIAGGGEYCSESAQKLIEEAEKYLGVPYVWGGYSPSGFDCSGFVSYCLTNSGVKNTGHTDAQSLYDMCSPISESEAQPGDLIFFTGTYNSGTPVSHVGIYLGNGQMIHCGHPVQYSSIYTPYWQSHFYAFGRIF